MLRRLDFMPDAPTYETLQQATVVTNAQFPIGELIVLAEVQKKFEAIGVPKSGDTQLPGGIMVLRKCTGGSMVLEEPEFNALVKAFDGCGWVAAWAQKVSIAKKFLTDVPEYKPDLAASEATTG